MNGFLASIHHSTFIIHNWHCWPSFRPILHSVFEDPAENYNGFTLPEPDIVVLINGCPR